MIRKSTESVIDEIHRIRREISDRFGGDIAAIAEDAARRQAQSNRPVWQPKPTNKRMQPSRKKPVGLLASLLTAG